MKRLTALLLGLLLCAPVWAANTNITALPAASTPDGTEVTAVDQAGATKKATLAQIKTFASASPTLVSPALGTPSSGLLTNATGLPLTTGVTGTLPVANGGTGITSLGTGIATWWGTPSSANLASALTDETGTGVAVFGTSPTISGHPVIEGVTSTGATGTGKFVYDTSPALVTPNLGTPTAGVMTNVTGTASGLTAGAATALAVNGANCSAGQAPLGVDASGAAESCTAYTTAAIVPVTAPSAGQILVGNAGGTAYAPVSASGDVTISSTGAHTLANNATARTDLGLDSNPTLLWTSNTSAVSLGNDNSAHSIFPSANDAFTANANTDYKFECHIRVTNGNTTHTDAIGFGGTATFTSLGYWTLSQRVNTAAIGTSFSGIFITSASSTVIDATTTNQGLTLHMWGQFRVNGAGTIIPQITFSADPTGTNQTEPNSFCQFQNIGTDTATSNGPWG